jgi:hypothetical protein
MQGLTDNPIKLTVPSKAVIATGGRTLGTATSVGGAGATVYFPVSDPICLVYTDPDGNAVFLPLLIIASTAFLFSCSSTPESIDTRKGVDLNLFSPNDPKNLDDFAKIVTRSVDTFVVGGHGFSTGIEGPNGIMTAQELATEIKTSSNYKGQSVTLFSCNTGASLTGFAQQLSDELGVPVHAPDNLLWYYSDGREPVIAPYENPDDPKNSLSDLTKQGNMLEFQPKPKSDTEG